MTLKEARKTERARKHAIKIMKTIGLSENVISRFENGEVTLSNYGVVEMLSEKVKELIKESEKSGSLVYHAIYSKTNFGVLVNLLYVSAYENDWECELSSARTGSIVADCNNITYPECSEHGYISVAPYGEGLVRTA